MSYTVIAAVRATGHMVLGSVFSSNTPDEAIVDFCAKQGVARNDLSDVIVLLGMVGSSVVHESLRVARKHRSYSQEDLEKAFALVRPSGNWKGPIDATIPLGSTDEEMRVISHAVTHFTGSVPSFTKGRGGIRVTAAGYYATIGA